MFNHSHLDPPYCTCAVTVFSKNQHEMSRFCLFGGKDLVPGRRTRTTWETQNGEKNPKRMGKKDETVVWYTDWVEIFNSYKHRMNRKTCNISSLFSLSVLLVWKHVSHVFFTQFPTKSLFCLLIASFTLPSPLLPVSVLVQWLQNSEKEVAPAGQAPDKPQL